MMKKGMGCYASGGVIRGPGTGTSDSVPRRVPAGSYILPADTTRKVGGVHRKVPVKVSNGETEIPPTMVKQIGVHKLDMLRHMTHKPVHPDKESKAEDKGESRAVEKREGMGVRMKNGGKVRSYADGGLVEDPDKLKVQPVVAPAPAVAPADVAPAPVAPQTGGVTGSWSPPEVGGVRSVVNSVAPGVTATVAGAAQDAADQFGAGNNAAGVGQIIRGVAALPIAAADDTVGRGARAVGDFVGGVLKPVGNALYTAATGNNAPAFGATPTVAKPADNAQDQRLAAGTQTAPAIPTIGGTEDSTLKPAPLSAPATAPQPAAPYTGGSITKTVLNPDGTPGKTTRWGNAAGGVGGVRPMSDLGSAYFPEVTSDGRVLTGEGANRQRALDQTAAVAQAAADAADPVGTAIRKQRELGDYLEAKASQGSRAGYQSRLHALQGAYGVGPLAGASVTAADAAARNSLETKKFGVESAAKAPITSALGVMGNPNATDEQRSNAQDLLLAAHGRSPREAKQVVVPQGTTIDPNTNLAVHLPSRVLDTSTGKYVDQPKSTIAPEPTVLPPRDKLIKGKVYQLRTGPHTWDGKQFMPGGA